ncbi:MAG TPA: CHASE3 domain-containing protein [Gaiellaceae bacterium]|nr:CHASE3 domain-containing protein [Gaiellaceae bacterium]
MRVGLNGRMLAASLLLAAIVAAAFAVLVLAIGSLRGASREAQRGDRVAAAANDLERLAIDLETGERGFVVTGRQSFLRPWEEARRQIPAKERTLRALVRDPARRERVLELERAIDRYLRTWSVPTVTLARADLAAAVGEIATGVGKAQMDLIRALFADFLRDNSRLSASRRDRAASAGDRAVLLGVVGLAGSTALILAFGGYFARAVVAPVRRLARAAGRLGAGDLSTRVSEAGAAEIGELARAFNRMAASLERTRSELEHQNAELDAFTYSVSHDLRAPLRAIDGFSRLLEEDYADALPPEGRRYLGLVGRNTQQMGQLIDGLLAFSRLSKQQLGKRAVDMGALAEEVLAELGGDDRPGLRVTVGPLPPARGDPVLLRQVLANLLSNAYKYTGGKEAATIEVGAYEEAGETVYFVRDDGVGFDMRYANKLFQVFQRLHRAEDYEGTGLGLALVARIVRRHGGRVWADAKPGEGATFFFTLGNG